MDEQLAADKVIRIWPLEIGLTRREPSPEAERYGEAVDNLGREIVRRFRVEQMVVALDRALRRWPWLYRRLGGEITPRP